ncbi:BnaC03g56610D [Brassica napus]|uniref:Sulfotransferase n=1 Tax=Brassica napus TaxID=3708 RepID=A0A078HA32_BRANA|nr:BnaC03g56610D [Brassica napus]
MNEKELPESLRGDNISEETKSLISSLSCNKDFLGKIYNYQGCWYYPNTLQGVLNFQKGFKPQETDIIIASFPKSGNTWLKALTIALFVRLNNTSSSSDALHPLQSDNPHGLAPFLETILLFSTHMPLHTLQEPFKDSSTCKIVYVYRNVKDVLYSFESLCSGSFWVVRSLRKKKIKDAGLEINKTGKASNNMHHSVFFRKGEVGDFKNHLTPEMENKIDMIVEEKYKGSGLKF